MSIVTNIGREMVRHTWDIGLIETNNVNFGLEKEWDIHIVKHPYKNKWFADPFIYKVTEDAIYLFVEEFDRNVQKGRLAKLVVDRSNYQVKDMKIILELPTHLSFPFIYRDVDNNLLVIPENSKAGVLSAYKYDETQDQLTRQSTIITEPLADAIAVQIEGHHFILSTKVPDENENKLLIFKSDTFGIDYELSQTITLPDKTARNAGAVFDYAGKKYKVSQIFDGGYGKGLVFYQVLQQEDKLSIIESFRKYPLNGYSGMHTFNQYYGYAVVDLCRQIHPFWNKVYKLLHK